MEEQTYSDGKATFVRKRYVIDEEKIRKANEAGGAIGYHGPNSHAYAVQHVCEIAMSLRRAIRMYAYGYMPDCDPKKLINNPLTDALIELGKFDKQNCHCANWEHNPDLFNPLTI